jgi:Zn-dependent protease
MNDAHQDRQGQKHLENLHAVAAHLAHAGATHPRLTAPTQPHADAKKALRRWGPLGVMLVFVLGKLKWVWMVAKFAKLPTLLTMLVAIWVYATIWGLRFAIGFVLLIFIHELGHVLVLRQQGIAAGAPVFIPFVGAVIAMKGRPRDAYVEAMVGLGGPALGTVGAVACLLVAWWLKEPFWYALASTGFLINLFNMLPISPLDGGRIAGVISQWLWVAGLGLGVILFIHTRSPVLFLILVLGGFTLVKTIKHKDTAYYEVSVQKRTLMAILYFGLIGVMAIGMMVAEHPLQGLH